jgi:hypothetical protein
MKKLLLGLALVLFVGTVSASIYAVSNQNETNVAQSKHDGDKDKKCEKKECCKNTNTADKSVEGKACCQKEAMKKCDEKSGEETCDKQTEKKACCQKPAAEHK